MKSFLVSCRKRQREWRCNSKNADCFLISPPTAQLLLVVLPFCAELNFWNYVVFNLHVCHLTNRFSCPLAPLCHADGSNCYFDRRPFWISSRLICSDVTPLPSTQMKSSVCVNLLKNTDDAMFEFVVQLSQVYLAVFLLLKQGASKKRKATWQ